MDREFTIYWKESHLSGTQFTHGLQIIFIKKEKFSRHFIKIIWISGVNWILENIFFSRVIVDIECIFSVWLYNKWMKGRPSCFCSSHNYIYVWHIICYKVKSSYAMYLVNPPPPRTSSHLTLSKSQSLSCYPDLQGLVKLNPHFSFNFTSFYPICAHIDLVLQPPYSYPTYHTFPRQELFTPIAVLFIQMPRSCQQQCI